MLLEQKFGNKKDFIYVLCHFQLLILCFLSASFNIFFYEDNFKRALFWLSLPFSPSINSFWVTSGRCPTSVNLLIKSSFHQKSNTQVLWNSGSNERLQKVSVNNMLSFFLTVIVCSYKVWLLFLHASQFQRLKAVALQLFLL